MHRFDFRRGAVVCAALASLSLTACYRGQVVDAQTGSAVNAVSVTQIGGNCAGTGCPGSAKGTSSTDTSGIYYFDAYGDWAGSGNVQVLTIASGEESVVLRISKSGYRTVEVVRHPDFENFTYKGKDYSATVIPATYLCRTTAPDDDGDGLCNAAEARYGTDPFDEDTDDDGFTDAAEVYGYSGIDFAYYGASPLRRDVFLEIDYFPGLKPDQAAIDTVVNAFANAPLSNPDGSTGITLHAVWSSQISAADVDNDLDPVWTDFDVIKNKYFRSYRAPVFHYVLFANQYGGGTSSGRSRGIPGRDLLVTLGAWSTPGGTTQQQAGTLMHEFGHNLGLRHGGNQNTNYKPNYLSVMSYAYQTVGLRRGGATGVVDYSRVRLAAVNENSLSEPNAFAPLGTTTEADLATYQVRICTSRNADGDCTGRTWLTGNAGNNLDMNRNGVINGGTISTNLNGDGDSSDNFAASQNDWDNLTYTGGGIGGGPGLAARVLKSRLQNPLFAVHPTDVSDCMHEEIVKK